MKQLTITKPDDWHLHLRDGLEMKSVVGMTAKQMGRAIIMPNLSPPIKTSEQALLYREEIIQALPNDTSFSPLMTLYLTDNTTQKDIIEASNERHVYAVKLYPAGATTNSDSGVTNLSNTYPVLEQMQKEGVPLLIHGEVTDNKIDIFDREKVFLDSVLGPLVENFPGLKVVLEHITTKEAGSPKFFLGTDSAPHDKSQKESACGCAGVFSAHAAIELYAEAFDGANKIDMLEGFASYFGPDFYGLSRNIETITLEKTTWQTPESFSFSSSTVIPFYAGRSLSWKLKT